MFTLTYLKPPLQASVLLATLHLGPVLLSLVDPELVPQGVLECVLVSASLNVLVLMLQMLSGNLFMAFGPPLSILPLCHFLIHSGCILFAGRSPYRTVERKYRIEP